MIPTAEHLNFYDESIGLIHTIKLTGLALHRLLERCRYSRISTSGEPVGWRAPDYPKKGREIECEVDWPDDEWGDEWDEEFDEECNLE
jgi:hypothetical protein